MKKKNSPAIIPLLFFAVIALLTSCCFVSCDTGKGNTETENMPQTLNISVYLDLSDRITREMMPSQKERDIKIVTYIAEKFKNASMGYQLLQSENKMKVFFYPSPQDKNITTLASKLTVDLGKMELKDKKPKLLSMQKEFAESLGQIYSTALSEEKYIGSDIWGFFSDGMVDKYCIKKGARNILVILTDGFIYDERNKQQNAAGDSCSYLLSNTLGKQHLWIKRNGLKNLDILLMELNPYTPAQNAPLREELIQWFKGMGVKRVECANTDLPDNTQSVIDDFLK